MHPSECSAIETPWHTLYELEMNSITFVCVNVFVLISGYFSIRPKRKSLLRFITQILFWAYFTTFVGALIRPESFSFSANILNGIVVMRQWFVFCYLGLFMFAPVLNSYIDRIQSHELLRFIGIYYAFSLFFGYICYGVWGTPKDFLEGMSILSLIGLYFVGSYLKKVETSGFPILRKSAIFYISSFFGLTVFQSLFAFALLRLGVKSSPYGYMNPIILLESVCLFMFFAKLKIRYNKWINFWASSALAAYLLHCSPSLGMYYGDACRWIADTFSPALPVAILFMMIIYIIAVLIDKLWWSIFNAIDFKNKK